MQFNTQNIKEAAHHANTGDHQWQLSDEALHDFSQLAEASVNNALAPQKGQSR